MITASLTLLLAAAMPRETPPSGAPVVSTSWAPNLAGFYDAEKRVGPNTYRELVSIFKEGEYYRIKCFPQKGDPYTGFAIQKGNTLSIAWLIEGQNQSFLGVGNYAIGLDRLCGDLTFPERRITGRETMIFLKRND